MQVEHVGPFLLFAEPRPSGPAPSAADCSSAHSFWLVEAHCIRARFRVQPLNREGHHTPPHTHTGAEMLSGVQSSSFP